MKNKHPKYEDNKYLSEKKKLLKPSNFFFIFIRRLLNLINKDCSNKTQTYKVGKTLYLSQLSWKRKRYKIINALVRIKNNKSILSGLLLAGCQCFVRPLSRFSNPLPIQCTTHMYHIYLYLKKNSLYKQEPLLSNCNY